MKNTLLLALAVALTSCGSDSTTGTTTKSVKTDASPVAGNNPDPRVETIRQQHEQLLSIQRMYLMQLGQLKGYEKLTPERMKKSEGYFSDYVQQSKANLMTLDQLNASKAQDPAQVALIGEIAEKQKSIMERANKRLAGIHNEHYLSK
jgi:ABC-type transporter MlaC component